MKCKIIVDDVCPVCLLSTEDVYHLMFEYSHLAQFNDFMKIAIRKFCVIKRRNIAIKENNILNIEEYFKIIAGMQINYFSQ